MPQVGLYNLAAPFNFQLYRKHFGLGSGSAVVRMGRGGVWGFIGRGVGTCACAAVGSLCAAEMGGSSQRRWRGGAGAVLRAGPLNYLFLHAGQPGSYCLGVFDNAQQGTLLGGITFRDMLVQVPPPPRYPLVVAMT